MSSIELCAACSQPLAYPLTYVFRDGVRQSYHLDCYEPLPESRFVVPGESLALSWAREAYASSLGLIDYWEQCRCEQCVLDQSIIDAYSIDLDLLVAEAHPRPTAAGTGSAL